MIEILNTGRCAWVANILWPLQMNSFLLYLWFGAMVVAQVIHFSSGRRAWLQLSACIHRSLTLMDRSLLSTVCHPWGWNGLWGSRGSLAQWLFLTISAVWVGSVSLCLELCSLKPLPLLTFLCHLLRSPSHGPTPVPCPLPVLRSERWAVLPAVPEVRRHGPGCALQHRQLRPAHLHDRTHHGPEGGLLSGRNGFCQPKALSSYF